MTKLLRVRCVVFKDGFSHQDIDPEDDSYDIVSFFVDRYYTSEDMAQAFEYADRETFLEEYGYDFYHRVSYSWRWVEVDETKIPKGMIDSSVF